MSDLFRNHIVGFPTRQLKSEAVFGDATDCKTDSNLEQNLTLCFLNLFVFHFY